MVFPAYSLWRLYIRLHTDTHEGILCLAFSRWLVIQIFVYEHCIFKWPIYYNVLYFCDLFQFLGILMHIQFLCQVLSTGNTIYR